MELFKLRCFFCGSVYLIVKLRLIFIHYNISGCHTWFDLQPSMETAYVNQFPPATAHFDPE